jgi:hypothetical protein
VNAWERKRLAEAAALLKWLIAQGATSGAVLTREDMANAMGCGVPRIDKLVRYLRENPQFGFAVTMRRGGRQHIVTVSTPQDAIQGQSILEERRVAYDAVLMHYWQIARSVATEYVHWNNIASAARGTNEAAQAKKTRKEHRKQLVLIQSALQAAKRPEEAELDQFIDEVLAT